MAKTVSSFPVQEDSLAVAGSTPGGPKAVEVAFGQVQGVILEEWTFEPSLNRLENSSGIVRLEPKVAALLLFLVEHACEVVTKDDLVATVWEGRFVADSALTRTMAELRRALGDDARHPRFIETISKKGYRLLVKPEPVAPQPGAPESVMSQAPAGAPKSSPSRYRWWAVGFLLALAVAIGSWSLERSSLAPGANSQPTVRSVVVLPLEDLSPQVGGEYFASSMTEALNTDLARLGVFRVISGRSIEQYVEASGSVFGLADELGADATVGGTIVRADGRVRIDVRLAEVATGTQLWAESYERPFVDVLNLQREVAGAIAKALGRTSMAGATSSEEYERSVDPQAHDLYLQGTYLLRRTPREGENGARELFEQALALDPSLALAQAGLADYYTALTLFAHLEPHDGFPRARSAALAALEIDPDLGEAHAALAQVEFLFDWNWKGANERFQKALQLNPSYTPGRQAYSFFLTCMAHFKEAERQARIELELDPLNSRHHLGWVLFNARQYESSMAATAIGRELKGGGKSVPLVDSWSLALLGRYEESLELLERRWTSSRPTESVPLAVKGWVYSESGREQEARGVLSELAQRAKDDPGEDLYPQVIVHTALGEIETALDLLERAVLQRSPNAVFLKTEPFLDPLRGEPRFSRLIQNMKLDEDL